MVRLSVNQSWEDVGERASGTDERSDGDKRGGWWEMKGRWKERWEETFREKRQQGWALIMTYTYNTDRRMWERENEGRWRSAGQTRTGCCLLQLLVSPPNLTAVTLLNWPLSSHMTGTYGQQCALWQLPSGSWSNWLVRIAGWLGGGGPLFESHCCKSK